MIRYNVLRVLPSLDNLELHSLPEPVVLRTAKRDALLVNTTMLRLTSAVLVVTVHTNQIGRAHV